MKNERQNRIIRLVTEREIETQEELMELLRQEGYTVTQATVSRDLKDLKMSKSMSAQGKYRYEISAERPSVEVSPMESSMFKAILQTEYSLNNVVIKTTPGMAQAVAFAIDSMALSEILGCVAGDDTIIIVTRHETGAAEVIETIRKQIKSY